MRDRTIISQFVRAALHGAKRRGEDVGAMLAAAGIPASVLGLPSARVSFEQYARLIQHLWVQLDDELLGFGRRPIRYGSFAMMCQAIIHCGTLGRALSRGCRFYALLQGSAHVRLSRAGDRARIVIDCQELDDPEHFMAESLLVTWHRLSSWLIGRRIPLLEVSFDYAAPAHRSEYDLIYGAPLRFEAEQAALCFAASYLDAPLMQDENSLRIFLSRAPYDLLSRPELGNSLGARIRRMLRHGTQDPGLDLDTAAARLAMSTQTLRRRLQQEGQSFQTIKDDWRRDLAISLLADTALPIAEIARRAGFSEPSALHRAFKKWTGLAPGAYREHAPRERAT